MTKLCQVCGEGTMQSFEVKDYAYRTNMGPVTINGVSKFLRCDHCERESIPGTLILEWNRKLLGMLAVVRRELKPKEIVFALSVLPYTQTQLAKAMGLHKTAISHYKTGGHSLTGPADAMFRQFMAEFAKGRSDVFDTMTAIADEKSDSDGPTSITSLAARGR